MKQAFLLIASFAAIFAISCSKVDRPDEPGSGGNNGGNENPQIELSISPASLLFTADGGSEEVEVTANDSWVISGKAAWCNPSATSGTGNETVTFTAAENLSEQARNATIKFKSGSVVRSLTITH